MYDLTTIGAEWTAEQIEGMTDEIIHVKPSQFNEENRYLPESVSSIPGPLSYDINPFMKEIVDCFDVNSSVREVNLMKGVQITYSTVLESGALYFMGHVKTLPMMYMTADKELATARVENNFIPMLNHSGMADIIRSSDEGNSRKTGKTANHLQFEGGGYMVPFGAKNADKMRSYSICVMLKDEIDAWPETVGKDGDPDKLSDGRCKGYWERRKIFRGSTPTIKGVSKIEKQYERGDKRHYMVKCLGCGKAQSLQWHHVDEATGVVSGMLWDLDEHDTLIEDSVRYACIHCGHAHYEHHKELLFSPDHGAKWVPTAKPKSPGIRSYHLSAMYSPIGMAPWYSLVADFLEAYDPKNQKVLDWGKWQVFVNNVKAETYQIMGARIGFQAVSAHRRSEYTLGTIPNTYAIQYSGSPILFLTCLVDVHKSNLAVAVIGWTRDHRSYVVDYWRFEVEKDEDDCSEITSPVWGRLRELIDNKEYVADDGKRYQIPITLIDSGYASDTVLTFCSEYGTGVYPIKGRDRPMNSQNFKEFGELTNKLGLTGFSIVVDIYKDRMGPVLRREWAEASGIQPKYHFNAPVDITDKQLKELTKEYRTKQTDAKGRTSYHWQRPSGADNELWDLLVYGSAAVDIVAWLLCIETFELEQVDYPKFWDYIEAEKLYYSES